MRAVEIDDLQPGLSVGRPLVDASGQILLQKGVLLSEAYIQALRARGYSRLYVRDEDDDSDVDFEEDITLALRGHAIQTLRKAFDEVARELASLRAGTFDDIGKALSSQGVQALVGPDGPLANIQSVVDKILEEVLSRSVLAGLTSLKSQDSRIYDHSIDVCVLAIMIGRTVNLNVSHMRQLAAGCLLHDVGLMFVKNEKDENKRIRQHTMLGYEILRSNSDPGILTPHVAYEHHEHQDGSGLPRGLVGSNAIERDRKVATPIPTLVGEIAAVANVYDNLLSGTREQPPMPPDAALREMAGMAGTILNREVLDAFRKVVPVYPVGTQVLLRGEPFQNFVGVVAEVNEARLARPVVILVRDGGRNKIEPVKVDMHDYPDISLRIVGL